MAKASLIVGWYLEFKTRYAELAYSGKRIKETECLKDC